MGYDRQRDTLVRNLESAAMALTFQARGRIAKAQAMMDSADALLRQSNVTSLVAMTHIRRLGSEDARLAHLSLMMEEQRDGSVVISRAWDLRLHTLLQILAKEVTPEAAAAENVFEEMLRIVSLPEDAITANYPVSELKRT